MVEKDCKCKSCKCKDMTMDEMISIIDDQTLPFTETIVSENEIIREFKEKYPDHLYKWHSDPEDRLIKVLEDSDWKFQYDNDIPTPLLTGIDIKIPKGTIHRIIPGKSQLKILIKKN